MTRRTRPVLGMVLKGYPRISETFISNEILGLERQGLSVHIFSMRQPREAFCHESVRAIAAPVDYLPETLLRPLPVFLFHNARLAARVPARYRRALSLAASRYARTRKSATWKHLFQAGYLVDRLLPGAGVAHLHAHFAHSPTSVALFTSILSGLPFSFTAHAKDIYTSHPGQLREKIEKARFVVTCTEYNRRHLKKVAGNSRTPIHRIYHGIDLSLFASRSPGAGVPSPPYRLLTIARITEKKGLPTVYEALSLLKKRGVMFRHTLIGDGEARQGIEALIRRRGLQNETRLLGTRPHGVVLDHFEKTDLFVIGCRLALNGDRDGIPNVLVESMAMGVPVVATRISAIPELVRDRETGLLVPPENPGAMADAVMEGLTDGGLRRRMVTGAAQTVRRRFDNRPLIAEFAALQKRALELSASRIEAGILPP